MQWRLLLLTCLSGLWAGVASEPDGSIVCCHQDWGELALGQSVMHTALNINNNSFTHGLGTHAMSTLLITLPAPAIHFTAQVGIDGNPDTRPDKGSVRFLVEAGGRTLFTSPVLRGGQPPFPVTIDLGNVRTFFLRVTDGGDGIRHDQANWAEAIVTLVDGRVLRLQDLPVVRLPDRVPPPPPQPLPTAWTEAITGPQIPRWRRASVDRVRLEGEWGRRLAITSADCARLDIPGILSHLGHAQQAQQYLGLGKLADAVARLAAYDPTLRPTRDALIAGILARQTPEGYLGGWQAGPPLTTSGIWEVHELSYLIVGLCTDHRLFGDPAVLDAARRAGDYLITHLRPLDQHGPQNLIGLDLALLALHERTGNLCYLDVLRKQLAPTRWLPSDQTPHGHLYEHLSLCVGQLELCARSPDADLLLHAHRMLEHLESGGGLLVNGGSSNREHVDTSHGSAVAIESCTTAYLIRALARIFELTGDLRCPEIIERTVNNALFAAQLPDGSGIRYFTMHETESGLAGPYVCCPMNLRRAISELPELVACAGTDSVAICQYVPGRVGLTLGDGRRVDVHQTTTYPNDGRVDIRVEPVAPGRFTIQLRLPRWCMTPRLTVNGVPVDGLAPGTWAVIERVWTAGDRINLDLPMAWRWVGGQALQTGKAALLRGPLVWRLDPARSDVAGIPLELLAPATDTIGAPFPDPVFLPNGHSVRLRGRSIYAERPDAYPATLMFTTYPDPAGRQVWFPLAGREAERW